MSSIKKLSIQQKLVMIDELKMAIEVIKSIKHETPCSDCRNFEPDTGCSVASAMPPKEVLNTGCPEWNYNEQATPF